MYQVKTLNKISPVGLAHLTESYILTDKTEDADAILVRSQDMHEMEFSEKLEAISRAMLRIRGSYAFGIMFHDHPGKIFAARKDSPLIIGKSQTGCLIASDVPAILDKTRNVYYIGNHEIAELSQDEIHFYRQRRDPEGTG